ncbi:hypothetical protein PR202_gb29038 [Eleusine coracana subsp. coracana]|uniref:At1g61320/AtMIF1 LRR domain-containing protein n=1 Tax=Eleusine coracana subsp. coracana TaxID=191504 RepID=A0AAV5FYD7_ELECO|nr:hypothetical protein PR202_gb29038 [Eleusine coracana subsp. coracana]
MQDIWWHTHSLLPLIDAARVACVSRDFVQSWRFCPNLTFTRWTLNLYRKKDGKDCQLRVDNIMKKHAGIGMKTFMIDLTSVSIKNDTCYFDHLNSWLQIVVKQGIEELSLFLKPCHAVVYDFPCALLSGETGASLRSLLLSSCIFCPTIGICLRSLTSLMLSAVSIKEEELTRFLSSVPVLESLQISRCYRIACIRIPCLQKLNYLCVLYRCRLQLIESKAPNLSSFYFAGELSVQFSLASANKIEKFEMFFL